MADFNGVERTYANKDEYDFQGGEVNEQHEGALTKHELFMWQAPCFNFELDEDQLLSRALEEEFVVQVDEDQYVVTNNDNDFMAESIIVNWEEEQHKDMIEIDKMNESEKVQLNAHDAALAAFSTINNKRSK